MEPLSLWRLHDISFEVLFLPLLLLSVYIFHPFCLTISSILPSSLYSYHQYFVSYCFHSVMFSHSLHLFLLLLSNPSHAFHPHPIVPQSSSNLMNLCYHHFFSIITHGILNTYKCTIPIQALVYPLFWAIVGGQGGAQSRRV